jgi:[ribosomal protein S5]-alanine N-acetyltransferase
MLPIDTQRLILRHLRGSDLEDFLAYRNDREVARLQSWEGISRAEAVAFIASQEILQPGVPGQWLQIAIAARTTDQLIGDCALKVHGDDPRQATIGVTLSRSVQRRGYATEALSALLDGAFARMKLHRIVADTDPENVSAWRLLERLGMRREAHLRQSLWFKGRWADEYIYAIREMEWTTRRGRQVGGANP